MANPPITRFTSLATAPSPTNPNNGLYVPPLTTAQIAAIPAGTKVNGGLWYNQDLGQLEAVIGGAVHPIQAGASGVFGPDASTINNIAVFNNKTGTLLADSGVSIAQVLNQAALLRFSNSLEEETPNALVNEIGNLGHIRFINDVCSIYVDTLTSIRFFPYDDQICSVFTSEVGSSGESTSKSALLEINSDSGALLLSRMTSTGRDALSVPSGANGMLLFNTTSQTFNGFDGTNWRDLPLLNTNGTLTVAEPTASTDAATKNYVDAAVSGIPTATITLTGNVTGSGLVSAPIITTLNMTLDQIKVPTSSLNLSSQKIINLLDPTLAQDGATKNYVDTRTITLTGAITGSGALGTSIATTLTNINTSQITNFNAAVTAFRLDQFAAPIASVSLGSQKITNLLNPTLAQDGATKNYVDTSISGAGIAPNTAKYIIQTANGSLANAQVLGALTSGLLKNATTTGVLSTAVAGTDYYSPGNPTRILDDSSSFYIGSGAGGSVPVGVYNTGAGAYALRLITTGTYNCSYGYEAGDTTTGSYNSSFGVHALYANKTGSYNVAAGVNSGAVDGFSTESFHNNCVFLGSYTNTGLNTNVTNSVAIGYQAAVDASNCMVLGGSGANQLSVGIGLTPNAQFQLPSIHAPRKIVLFQTSNNEHQVFGLGTAGTGGGSAGLGGIFRFQINSTGSDYTWLAATSNVASNELMRLTGGGRVGIGNSSPLAPLHFSATATGRKIMLHGGFDNDHQYYGFAVEANILKYQIDNSASNHVFYAYASTTTSTELMRIQGNGRVGIGTAAPDDLLTVISPSPTKVGVGGWAATSDARIKNIVGDYERGLAEIIKIKTRKFKYNDKSGYPESLKTKINIGLIAQEIEDIFPECIVEKMNKGDITDMRLFDGTVLTYALINAVKELNNEIINLKQQIKR
jgi:hypothetical protein